MALEPNEGYVAHERLVKIAGYNFIPEPTLRVRFRTIENAHQESRVVHLYDEDELFYESRDTLVIRIPHITRLNLTNIDDHVVVIEVSINDGVDWTDELMTYTFKPTPQITHLSHNTTNLRAEFALIIYGF